MYKSKKALRNWENFNIAGSGAFLYLAASGEDKCSFCVMETKCICLKCKDRCCLMCSEMEIDKEIPGWEPGKSVGYYEACGLKMLDDESVESHQS